MKEIRCDIWGWKVFESMETIQIEPRSAYGRTNYYAVGQFAESIKALTKRETVTLSDVGAPKNLGFRCVIVGRPEMPACEVIGVEP